MSIDRRIVSILHYNEIYDVNKVEKFIGTDNNNYYQVVINGKIKKLEIPGFDYFIKEKEKIEHVEKLESFTNNLDEVVEIIKNDNNVFTTTVETFISEKVEENEIIKIKDEEVKEENKIEKLKKPKTKTKSPKISDKKIEIISSKNKSINDDDIDDFINTI